MKLQTVQAVLRKWKQHRTIRDLPKAGRLVKVDARTRRRLARMAQSGEVVNAPELALVAAFYDLVHVSASTARNVLHQEGLQASKGDSKAIGATK
ncbi:helix-turn-helix domain-containing protein [archaeon]|nr:MAG: helix-turn-helix domain-containing protein [archaeon]